MLEKNTLVTTIYYRERLSHSLPNLFPDQTGEQSLGGFLVSPFLLFCLERISVFLGQLPMDDILEYTDTAVEDKTKRLDVHHLKYAGK